MQARPTRFTMPGSTIAKRSLLCAALLLGKARSLSSEWSTVPVESEPTARHEAATAALGGKAYLLGGRGVQPVEEFDRHAGSWRKLGPTPLEMHHFQPVAPGSRIYVMTAVTGRYPREVPIETRYVYDPANDSWRKGGPVPEGRRRGGQRRPRGMDLRGVRDCRRTCERYRFLVRRVRSGHPNMAQAS